MITTVKDLIPLMANVDLYGSSILDELTLSDFNPSDTVLLLDETARIEMCSNFIDEDSVSLLFNAHIGDYQHLKYRIEIPIFTFHNKTAGSTGIIKTSEPKNRIVFYDSGITVGETYKTLRTIATYNWKDMKMINKHILGVSWKYWFEKCGYEIVIEPMDYKT